MEVDINTTIIPYIGKASKLIGFFLKNRLQEEGFDLTSRQWIVLNILSADDGRSQQELALVTERDKASLVRLLQGMEKKNLILRHQDRIDKRINRVYITDHGSAIFEASLPTIEATFSDMQKGLSAEQINKAIEIISKLIENISDRTPIN